MEMGYKLMRIIAYRTSEQNNEVFLEESTGDGIISKNPVELFTFLVEQFEDEPKDYIQVCWDLDATVSLFLKLLGEIKCSQLKDTKRAHIAPFDIFYVPGKVFSITHIPTRTKCNLYGIEQYFVELDEPSDLAEVQGLGQELLKELKAMGLEPTKLTSPVAIYDQCVMQYLDLPKLKDMPKEAAVFAYGAAGRLWIETHQIGYWP